MVLLRCTRPVLAALRDRVPDARARDRSDTQLGDWYANRVNVAQRRYILALNEITLLAVVVPARDPAHLPERIRAAAATLFRNIGVRARTAQTELHAMREVRIARTEDRSVVASLTDFGWAAYDELYDLPHRPGRTLDHINLILAHLPVRARAYRSPAEMTRESLG